MRLRQIDERKIYLLIAVFFSTLLLSIVANSQKTVRKTVPEVSDTNPLKSGEYPADLKTPSNITTEAVYDPELGMFVVHTRLGDKDIVTPFLLTPKEYSDLMMRQDMFGYFRQLNSESY